jgi:hypothetical protein
MNAKICCAAPHCRRLFDPNPRVKNQGYCGEKACQRARKREWQKNKLAVDSDYRANQRDCQIEWHRRHPGYYKKYRQEHPRYSQRNNLLQSCRNAKARVIAKMDALELAPFKDPAAFYLVPLIAKMDASAQKVILIPMGYGPLKVIAKEDSIASRDFGC